MHVHELSSQSSDSCIPKLDMGTDGMMVLWGHGMMVSGVMG